jgi:outer membrane cobalamin receptor
MSNSKDWNAKFDYSPNEYNKLSINSGFLKNRAGAPGSLSYPDDDDKQVKLSNFLDLAWNFNPDTATGVKSRVYNNYDRLEYIENTAGPFDTANSKDIHTTNSRGFDFQFDKKMFDVYQIVCGFNYVDNFNDSTSSAKHKYSLKAWYLENQFEPSEKFKFNLGLRYDDYSNFGGQLNPSIGMLYKINPKNRINLLVARSFRAPTFNQLYWKDPWGAGDPNLKPEKAYTGEIGFESDINKYFTSGITYYHSKFTDLINWDTDPITYFSTAKNIGSAKIDGIEFNNKIYFLNNFEIALGYTYLLARDEKSKKFLVYQPRNKADISFKFKDGKGLQFALKGQFVDRRYADAENTVYAKQYFVFGLSGSKKFRTGTTFIASINNLFAASYQVVRGYPAPGFSITGGLRQEF